jgi:hypothetical protein
MPKVIINGSLSPTPGQPTHIGYDPQRGLVTKKIYRSAGDNLGGMANTLINANIAFNWRRSQIISEIETDTGAAIDGLSEVVGITWQLLANETTKSIFENTVTPVSGDEAAQIKFIAQQLESGEKADTSGLSGNAQTILDLYLRGSTHFACSQYALMRTITISNTFKVGSVPLPLATEALSENLIPHPYIVTNIGVPALMADLLAGIPAPAFQPGYYWSWRQLPSKAVVDAYNKLQVVNEWWLDQWALALYYILI